MVKRAWDYSSLRILRLNGSEAYIGALTLPL